MTSAYQKRQAALLKQLLAALPKQASAEEKRFTELCFEKMLVSDLERLEHARAIEIAHSLREFLQTRKPSEPKIRIFTPADSIHAPMVIELINDDMPFLVDSLTAELTRHGLIIREIFHPIIPLTRDAKGELVSLGTASDTVHESLIHFELSPLPQGLSPEQLTQDLLWVLSHIRAAVTDWKEMTGKVEETIAQLKQAPKSYDAGHISEVKDFLRWLVDRNFVFLGYAEYTQAKPDMASNKLGILRIINEAPAQDAQKQDGRVIEITKSSRRSPVHRYVPMDYIAITLFNAKGEVAGEARFVGLFTSNVYYQSTSMIPLVRAKAASVYKRSGFSPVSHDGKSLGTILEFLPRDEIFQMDEDELFETSMGILALEAKPGVRVFARKDLHERFVSAMVFVPKERFSTALRVEIQQLLESNYNGSTTSFTTQISDAPLARLHLIIKTSPGDVPTVDVANVERDIGRQAYLWSDQLRDALLAKHEETKALKLHHEYADAFPQSYINRYYASSAAHDIDKCETALAQKDLVLELYQRKEDEGFANLKIYNPNQQISLSNILPLLENAGFRVIEEYPFDLNPQSAESHIRIRDFYLQLPEGVVDILPLKEALEEALLRMWHGDAENDRFNTLVLKSGIGWREVSILRAYAKYLKQVGFNIAQPTITQSLIRNPSVVRDLIALFHARFEMDVPQRDVKIHACKKAIETALGDISNATEDRVIRRYMDLMMATLRTNYYQRSKERTPKPVLSFKFDSAQVPELPLPKPYAEIFVYSPRVEGIHLRGGKVARGGLRWSDRVDDFRTEVLGLMKAQMVKNSVIVPVGSKGGFVLKKPPTDGNREALQHEGIACYTLYLQGLLDLTDNIIAGKIAPPNHVVRHDGDDPYLVVAADKGTATFSDIANGVSQAYGFWLGDAFASGGSVGYDHKAMAITARGAWVSVSRHFSEMGKDIASEDFTCVGIGDMSGDVFGNGMLLSEHIRLVAAFNHMHIFIDPSPDAKATFAERKRLFDMPRSGWRDYDTKLISKGGGVYDRSAKTITISEEACLALGASKTSFTPDELIRAILQAPVDLLWNGGIGTYVKAVEETHDQVGDRTNNSLRINGSELRCKVVGEGGNLGFTQLGRIEYARAGGRINTDAIDNSAGVDCSDHEVNIKIAFSRELENKSLTLDARNKVLESMTNEVAELVLKDNQLQTLALSVSEQLAGKWLESQVRLIHALEKKQLLNRAIEFLPIDKHLQELKLAGNGLTRPELAVLLAYSKMDIYAQLSHSPMVDHPYFNHELKRYFPTHMQQNFADAIAAHPLRREIIATVLTNSVVNRVGMTFVNDLAEDSGASVADIAACYALVRDGFELRNLWRALDNLTGVIPVALQAELFAFIQQFVRQLVSWLLRNLPAPIDIDDVKSRYIDAAKKLTLASEALSPYAESLVAKQVPESLARLLAGLERHISSFDVIRLAQEAGAQGANIALLYHNAGERLQLDWLRQMLSRIVTVSSWERSAVMDLQAASYDEQRRLTALMAKANSSQNWFAERENLLSRYDHVVASLKADDAADIARATVVMEQLRHIA